MGWYRTLVWLLLPLALMRLWWRGWHERGYWQHVPERLGIYRRTKAVSPIVWLHAVSVGETRAAVPLVRALLAAYPQHQILLTHGTPSGRAMGQHLFGHSVRQCYLPYDIGWAATRFVAQFQPEVGLLMETELWPNLIAACRRARVPLLLVNARLSERSAMRYRRFSGLTHGLLSGLCAVAAQSEADAQRLRALGAQRVSVTGNLKFDLDPAPDMLALAQQWRAGLDPKRLVCVAASTRDGEEALILDAWQQVTAHIDGLLVLVPRHPQRFDAVARLLTQRNIRFQRRSEGGLPQAAAQVWLGDSMGEMTAWFALADIAIMGGSWLPLGGQNLIEATAVGCPVIVGPHMWNFAHATQMAVDSGAAIAVADIQELPAACLALLADADARQRMHDAGMQFSRQYRGATERVLSLVAECRERSNHG